MTKIHPAVYVLPTAIILAALSTFIAPFRLFLVGQLSVVIIVTAAMTLLMGAAGLLSLASAASMAIGAYGVLLLASNFDLPFVLAAVLTVVFGGLLGGILGLVALRLSGFHLAIVTLGFLQLLLVLLKQGGELTGGGYGLVVPTFRVEGWGPVTTTQIAVLCVFIMVVVVACCVGAIRSRVGRAWLALRDNEPAAQMQGIDVRRMKVVAFAFSSALISLAGVLHVLLLGVANPSAYLVHLSIFHITLVVVGGTTGTMTGAVVAPIILYFLPELFSALGEWRDFFYAAILLLTLVLLPEGMGPWLDRFAKRLLRRKGGAA
jgi:branched-chain amino acid transport system permease protein